MVTISAENEKNDAVAVSEEASSPARPMPRRQTINPGSCVLPRMA